MKVTVYIEKTDFDVFYQWLNRISLGAYSTPPIKFSNRQEDIQDPLSLSLDPREYTLIKDVERDIEEIQKTYGPIDIDFTPESTGNNLLIIQDILREATRKDLQSEIIYTALQVIQQLPDLNPIEAMIIAEREWLGTRESTDE